MGDMQADLRNLLKWAMVTLPSKDDEDFVVNQITYLGKKAADATVVYPYGYHAVAPAKSMSICFSVQNQEESRAIIEFDPKNRIKRGLVPGEVIVGNQEKKTFVYFKEDGSIEIEAVGDINIKASSTVNIDADLVVTGTITGQSDANIAGNLDVGGNIIGGATIVAQGAITATAGATPVTLNEIKDGYNAHTHVSNGPGNPTTGTSDPI